MLMSSHVFRLGESNVEHGINIMEIVGPGKGASAAHYPSGRRSSPPGLNYEV